MKWSPRSQNQMFDLPPGVRNYPPVGYKAGDWSHGSLPRELCSRQDGAVKMCTHERLRMVIFVVGIGEIYGPCKQRSVTTWKLLSVAVGTIDTSNH